MLYADAQRYRQARPNAVVIVVDSNLNGVGACFRVALSANERDAALQFAPGSSVTGDRLRLRQVVYFRFSDQLVADDGQASVGRVTGSFPVQN